MERVLQHQVVRIAPPAGGTLNQFDSLPRTPFLAFGRGCLLQSRR